MKKTYKISLLVLISIIIYSCSTKKNTVVSRNYHALTARYNVLFNGKEAFKKGLKQVEEGHKDNFWKRLAIEPITFNESKLGGNLINPDNKQSTSPDFDRAEEKAVKAVQKHSININGYEKNSQIDDAYLLLGKSRYYTQRFIPAVEAFNYIISNYPNAKLNYETRIWRAKSNIRLGNEELAIESMNLLLDIVDKKEDLPPRIVEQAHTAMAMAYNETDTIEKVVKHLKEATKTFYNKEQSARNMFILGQIYNELNQLDSAKITFKKLADKRKAPKKYKIHANIELAKNSSIDTSDISLIKRFKKLIRNTDNREYYDELYYQLGSVYETKGDLKKATEYYKKSLRSKNGSAYQKTYTYEKLANLNFNKLDYLQANAYYDSVMQVVPKEYENEKRIRRINRKNKRLVTLKKHEDIVKNNDSVLKVVAMSDSERKTFFTNHIEKIKKEDEERRQRLSNSKSFGNNNLGGMNFNRKTKGKWYFYNPQAKQFGKVEFENKWGKRPLEDNWRWSDKTKIEVGNESEEGENTESNKKESRYELSTYLNAIPTNKEEIKDLKTERNKAIYQLGLSYKEQFKNTKLAIQNLERIKKLNTDKDIELPINYHLYQLYTEKNNTQKINEAKNFILTNYSSSKIAEVIRNPESKISQDEKKDEDEVSKKYKEIYYLYKNEKYIEAVSEVNSYLPSIKKSNLIPKFALLKALAIGKHQSKEEYLKNLEFVAVSYANTPEGKKAKEIINRLKK